MTRLRIYKSIAIIATALTVGEASSVVSESSSKISSRFLDSLEHANNNSPLEEINDENENAFLDNSSSQRRELTWWTFALQLGTFIIYSFISFFLK